ncbi:MAG: ester cyclase [Flammeovirgaceae bacterium]|nr:ester cyclase [Flammeovirgaceae bacterium]
MDKNKEALTAFYRKALTVNAETTPAEVLSKVLADDFTSYGSVDSKGKEQLTGQVGFFWKLIPDLKWEPQEIINEGNKYVVRSIATGTPNGDFMGLPTNGTKSFKIMTIDVHTVENGKLKSVHHLEDWGTAMKQLKG